MIYPLKNEYPIDNLGLNVGSFSLSAVSEGYPTYTLMTCFT